MIIDILLATYNGEKFLREQIDSILRQTEKHWRLIVRDDSSDDSTREILEELKRDHPDKIILIDDHDGRLGPCVNFGRLLSVSDADYTMFCDQDDIWTPDKVETCLKKMREKESENTEKPILVHTDLKVVDQDLNVIHPSFMRMHRRTPGEGSFNGALMENNLTGCAMMINRRLRELAIPIPPEARMYDCWLGLTALCFGEVTYINIPTVLYRQHASNTMGAARKTNGGIQNSPEYFKGIFRKANCYRSNIERFSKQAQAFLDRFKDSLDDDIYRTFDDFASLPTQNWLKRRSILFKHHLWKSSAFKNLIMLVLI